MEKKIYISAVVIFLFSFVVFLPNIGSQFVSDDWEFLREAAAGKPTTSYFATNYSGTRAGGSYRPMVNVFWSVGYQLFGTNSVGFHLFTTIFHSVNSVLIFVLILRLPVLDTGKRFVVGILAAVFFAVLPAHAEAVAWIAVANDTLMTFFYLLSLYFLLLAPVALGRKRIFNYGVSILLFAMALLTKEMALSLPAVVFFGSFFVLEKDIDASTGKQATPSEKIFQNFWRAFFVTAPYLVVVLVYFFVRGFATGMVYGYYAHELVLSKVVVFRSMVSLFLAHVFNDWNRVAVTNFLYSRPFVAVIIFLFAAMGVFFLRQKKDPARILFFVGSWFVSFAPVIFFTVRASPFYLSNEGERFVYLPSVFFSAILSLIFVTVFFSFKKRGRFLVLAVGLCILASWFVVLEMKLERWRGASRLVDKAINSAVLNMRDGGFDGAVFVGRPDSLHGAYMFRNGLTEALAFELGIVPDAIEGPVYTLLERNIDFSVLRKSEGEFAYFAPDGKERIAGPNVASTSDISAALVDPIHDPDTGEYLSDRLLLKLTPEFVAYNRERGKRIGIFFYNGDGWDVFEL